MTVPVRLRAPSRPFVRPKFNVASVVASDDEGGLRTVPDLVEHNARHNPGHLFCLQYGHNIHAAPKALTMADLHDAVLRFCNWLALRGLAQVPKFVDGKVVKAQPVAILMASDIGWFIAYVALLRLGIPVCPSCLLIGCNR